MISTLLLSNSIAVVGALACIYMLVTSKIDTRNPALMISLCSFLLTWIIIYLYGVITKDNPSNLALTLRAVVLFSMLMMLAFVWRALSEISSLRKKLKIEVHDHVTDSHIQQ